MPNSISTHEFGGAWTDKKLKALSTYLQAYRKIFTQNEKASYFTTVYFDAFAGTGSRNDAQTKTDSQSHALWAEDDLTPIEQYKTGSVRIALNLESPFDKYVFVDKKASHVDELKRMIADDYPQLETRCKVYQADANKILQHFCQNELNRNKERAVVFVDPYGMNIEWQTIAMMAETKCIDLWILFPLGTGVNRLLTRNTVPPDSWAAKLTATLGTEDWKTAFYKPKQQVDLFSMEDSVTKDATFESIGNFFISRLNEVFAGVAPRPLILYNTRNNPLYLLCFAASNEKAVRPALNIANWIVDSA